MPARILVIEDNPTNLDLMTYLLTAFGHTPLTAPDGEIGLAIVQAERPDLIICDIQLPIMDGYEIARWLKSHPELRNIPLVAVTALAMVGDRDKVLAAGFNGYIAKPIDPQTFVGQVERFLTHTPSPLPSIAPATTWIAPLPRRRATILVVDNLTMNIELARSTLEPFGYTIVAALSMAAALALAHTTPPDLILSDVNMESGSGYDLVQAINADPQLQHIPVILITSTSLGARQQARGLTLGAVRFLVRPIEPQDLLHAIESCLKEHSRGAYGDDSGC